MFLTTVNREQQGCSLNSFCAVDMEKSVVNIRNMSKCRNDKMDRYSEIFKALANPNRLHIFMRLAASCEPEAACCTEDEMQRCAGNVGQDLGLAPSTVSHHLKELRRAGLIKMERQGKRILCWAEPGVMEDLATFFSQRTSAQSNK